MPDTSPLAEAPVSIAAHIHVPSISKDALLVTGRGRTAAVAAANLRAAIAAIQAPALSSLARDVGVLFAAELEQCCAHNHKEYVEYVHDLGRASALVLMQRIECQTTNLGDIWSVEDISPYEGVVYTVTLYGSCTCTCTTWEYLRSHGLHCAHILATQWWQQLRSA